MFKSLVTRLCWGGRICRWLLLFWEFNFLVVKPGKHNVGPDRVESGENGGSLNEEFPDAYLFRVEVVPDHFIDIAEFLASGKALEAYTCM